jgi:hypothetical protein
MKDKISRKLRWSKLNFKRPGLIFAILVGITIGYLIFISRAAPSPPNVYLSPSARTMPANTTFSVQVRETSGSTAVNAVQANFSYPASLVDFVSIDSTGSAFTTEASSSGGSGQVSIARGIIGTLTGDQLIATVNFRTKTTSGTATMAFVVGTALVSSSTNQDILGGLSATTGGTYIVDTTAPTVNISAPTNGANLSGGSTVTVSVTATDADAVSSVDVYIDGAKATTLTSSPYNYSWNTTGLSLGSHTIQAKASDPSGNLGSSSIFTVTLADQTPPTVSITAPSASSTLKGSVTVSATANDNSGGTGVAKVEFYVDGTLKGTDTTSPYSYSWDTTTATNASHTLTAKAYDNASPANTTTSTGVSITVDNSAPTTPGNLRRTGGTATSISLAWDASTDNVNVTGYRVQRDGTTVTTTSGSTLIYADTSLASGTSYSYTVTSLDAAGNASAAATLNASTLASAIGDANSDGHINITDLSIILTNYGTSLSGCDFNYDGLVNIFDLSILLSHYGT